MTGATTTSGRPPVYKWFVLLPLLLENRPRRLCDIIRLSRYLLGTGCDRSIKPLMTEAAGRLVEAGILQKHRSTITPKRRPVGKKGAPYRHAIARQYGSSPALAEKFIALTEPAHPDTLQGQNHTEGRYESCYAINPRLPPDFVARLKHETAAFFGFESWHDGLLGTGWQWRSVMLNVRNAYAHKLSQHEGPSRPACRQTTNSDATREYPGDDPAEVEASEALMNMTASLGRKTRALIRRHRARVAAAQQNKPVSDEARPGEQATTGQVGFISLPYE